MDFRFTEEQIMIRNMVREFAEREIVPHVKEYDRAGRFPGEILKKMAPLGILGGPIPSEYGGMGLDFVSAGLIAEEIGRADFALSTTVSVQVALVCLTILQWGNETQKKKYLPRLAQGEILGCFAYTEPNVGSDSASIETSAARDGDSWVLKGAKMWISNGGIADLALVFAQTNPALGHRGITAFLVERGTPGFSSQDIYGKLGLRSSNTAQLFLDDCRVPEESVLGQVGQGFYVAMSALDNARYSAAAGCVGIAQGCIYASVKYAQERRQFGKPIGSFQLIQEMIADMLVETDAARFLVYRAGFLKDQGLPNTREVSMAKYYASEAAVRCADRAIQIHGGYGYSDEFPVERYWRDARVATIYEGTSQMQKLIIARDALGISAFR